MKDTVLAFNRELAQELGVPAALLYQELQRKYFYWKSQGKLNEDGMFWCDQGEIADWILIHPNTVGKAAKDLEDAGLIKKKVSYRPGTVTPTTWWGLLNTESTPKVISSNHSKSDFYIKANTESDTEKEITKSESRMKPEALYARVHSFFKGPNEMRKQKVEAIKKLQEEYELSDETILNGMKAISEHKTIKFDNGDEFTYTLTHLLLRSELEKTATLLVRKAEESATKKPVSDRLKTFVKITDM